MQQLEKYSSVYTDEAPASFPLRLKILLCFTRCATSLLGEVWLEAKIAYVARN